MFSVASSCVTAMNVSVRSLRFAALTSANVRASRRARILDADTVQSRLLRSRALGLGFGKISQPPQFAFLQNSAQVNQDDKAVIHLSDSGHVIQFAILENIRRKINGRFRDLLHF